MTRALVLLCLPLVLAAGCVHTAGSTTLPTLPASHGELSLSLARHLNQPANPSLAHLSGQTPERVMTLAEAPAVLARTVQVLEGQPTPAQVQDAAEDLRAACHEGLSEACEFLRARTTGPVRIAGQLPPPPSSGPRVIGMAVFLCRLGGDGRLHACELLEKAPPEFTEAVRESLETMRYQPATLAGHPLEIPYLVQARTVPRDMQLLPRHLLMWAQQRVATFPESMPAWFELAEQLATQTPEDPGYLHTLEHLHSLVPSFWWPANELAWAHVQAGEYAEAAELARSARKEAPHNAYVLETAAAASFGLGECAGAVADQRSALARLPTEWPEEERARFQKQLQVYVQRCPAPAATPAP